MADTQYLIQGASLEKLSNAVRENTGASGQMTIDEMAEKLNTGVVPVERGGTGATDAAAARTNLGAAASSHSHNNYIGINNNNYAISLTGGSGNTSGYRLLCSRTVGAWESSTNLICVVLSRHSGTGILCVDVAVNNATVSTSTITAHVNVFCAASQNIYDDSWMLTYDDSSKVVKLWWKYADYNSTRINILARSGFSDITNGSWQTTTPTGSKVWKCNVNMSRSYSSKLESYPVGAVYISWSSTSPASLFGGSWTAITGRFPYFNAGTGTGGANSHKLTASEMPSHNHQYWGNSNGHTIALSAFASNSTENVAFGWVNNNQLCFASRPTSGPITANSITGVSSGGNAAHNNMPAYQTVYAWRRTG